MWNLNARFVSQAAKRMTDTDALVLLNEAVNLEIAETAANLLREGVPEKIVADFVIAYRIMSAITHGGFLPLSLPRNTRR